MSVKDLMPPGFDGDHMRYYATISRTARVCAQGDKFGMMVWLEIDRRERIMIGYGLPNEAIAEAQETMQRLTDSVSTRVNELLEMQADAAIAQREGS